MSSLFAVPMQYVGVACEMLFIFENKLRGVTFAGQRTGPGRRADMILEEMVKTVLANAVLDDMFAEKKPLSIDQLRALMTEAAKHPSLKVEPHNIEKIFCVACMTMKVNLLCIETVRDIVTILNDKLVILQNMFTNPHMREEINRVRSAMKVFYGSLSNGALGRVRTSQINVLRAILVPVSTLINEGLQLESGHLVPRKSGPNTSRLGSYSTFAADGTKSDLPRIELADIDSFKLHPVRAAVVGENVFDRARELEMESKAKKNDSTGDVVKDDLNGSLSRIQLEDNLVGDSPAQRTTSIFEF